MSSSPATTWALVTTSPGPATHPEPSSPSPQAVPSTLTTLSPARLDVGVARDRRLGARARCASRPDHGPDRIHVAQQVEQRPAGRQDAVQRRQDLGPLKRIADVRARRCPDALRVAAPNAQASTSASPARSSAPPTPSSRAEHHPMTEEADSERLGDPLHDHRDRRSEQQPGEHRDERRVGRLAAACEQRRTEAAADQRPDHEARQRQRAGDQPALVSDPRERDREDHDDDVDDVQLPTTFLPA